MLFRLLILWLAIYHSEAFRIFPKQISHGQRHVKGSYRYMVDSRVCETTPGVKSYSGYIDTGNNQSMFFWFFEARNNPKTAPLGLWLNNMLYIDQPIATGFSYGDRNVFSSDQAAARVWEFFQTFFSIPTFSQYASREMTFWSESYGGHYGPKFTEYQSYYDYAQAKFNHVLDMANAATLAVVKTALNHKNGCLVQLKNCANNGSNDVCQDADNFCAQYVSAPLLGNRSTYYYRSDVKRAIGAETQFSACQDNIGDDFWTTADAVRPTISSLGRLLDSGLRIVIWAGDKDFICNSLGVYRSLLATKWKYSKQFAKAPWKNLTVHGKVGGVYKTTGDFVSEPQYFHSNPSDGSQESKCTALP
ncbi:hypothetical protein PGT21_018671 [Puccinia graminis f. sp. tritici]|uniref:Uncharacterized protein n=1 Tax=Puccinia graminis f. sp. tritici TaxID=56615 RepID=A0A5B0P777_PUCGR|nr:hypothetical protein PGT21_018671 [Puccinia graminis f. sp. tritici]